MESLPGVDESLGMINTAHELSESVYGEVTNIIVSLNTHVYSLVKSVCLNKKTNLLNQLKLLLNHGP